MPRKFIWNKISPVHQWKLYDINTGPMKNIYQHRAWCGHVFSHSRDDKFGITFALQWRHNGRNCVSNHQPHDCLPNRVFRHRIKKVSKLRVTGLCEGNSPVTSEFPAQRASNAENASIWWRHHGFQCICLLSRQWDHYAWLHAIQQWNCQQLSR